MVRFIRSRALRVQPSSILLILLAFSANVRAQSDDSPVGGLTYTNYHTREPWSVHVVRLDRSVSGFALLSLHARGGALGLTTLSRQVALVNGSLGVPVAAVNGDFYKRESAFAGDPRGLQISNSDLLSAPIGTASLWVYADGEPHVDDVSSKFSITFPDGMMIPFGLNEPCQNGNAVIYTSKFTAPVLGKGRELLLASDGPPSFAPFRVGRRYTARVLSNQAASNSVVPEGQLILLLSPRIADAFSRLAPGAKLEISTLSSPSLRGVRTALSGGPILIRDGKRPKLSGADSDSFEVSSMFERHPRTAVGWNEHTLFFVEVDGRQSKLSVGMTLDELSRYLLALGCENAMNFDGGGSSTLWYLGRIRNSPCDRKERDIANSLAIVVQPTGGEVKVKSSE